MRLLLPLAVLLLTACVSQPLPDGFQDPDDFDAQKAAKNRISLGLTYLKNGNYSQAKFNLDKAMQFAPRLADVHYSLAYYYQVVGENGLAEEAYQEAMDRDPRNPDIANTYGAFLCQQGKYEKAKTYFLKAVNSDNYISSAETFENLALCSHSQGQTQDAITYLQSALNHQPSRTKSLLLLSSLYSQTGQWAEAKQTLRRYEKLASVNAETLWLSVRIEQALGNTSQAQGYGDMLIHMYPEHPNTLAYIKSNRGVNPETVVAKPVIRTQKKVEKVSPEPDAVAEEVVRQTQNEEVTSVEPEPAVVVEQPQVEVAEQASNTVEDEAQGMEQPLSEEAEVALNAEEAEAELDSIAREVEETPVVVEQASTDVNEAMPQESSEDQPVPESEVTAEESIVPEQDGDPIYHIVQRHENLYRISLLYNVKMKRLVEWNQLEDASAISTGMRLLLVDPTTIE